MTATPLLSILIPTYNRAVFLQRLLLTLKQEISELNEQVVVLVSDNASTDETPSVLQEIGAQWPALLVQRHATNLGADGNFCSCIDRVTSPYAWILGDDDLPRAGLISQLCAVLAERQPDLVYLPSCWLPSIASAGQLGGLAPLQAISLDATSFAAHVNTWLTFVSGNVFNLSTYRSHCDASTANGLVGSSLVQLEWILSVLKYGRLFLIFDTPCVLATSGNTGGYSVMSVFGANFPKIVRCALSDEPLIADAILRRHVGHFLPSLIWQIRFSNIGRFDAEDANRATREQLRGYPFYWLFLWPIATLPKVAAWPFYAVARLLKRLKSAD